MNHRAFILATAGHVDHGKSSLVRALTGTDPDRLPEEKARGMTIELGFAYLNLKSPAVFDETFDIGIVDVPGHEDFVKNMVAGVGSIDAALLVVAADDGWMTQTEEHLQILKYFGVRHAVVTLTKTDLAIDAASAERAVRERLRATPFVEAPIVRTSTKDERDLDDLRRALSEMFASMTPSQNSSKPRLAVDRAFSIKGVGTVVTGTLIGGEFHRGDEVVLQPAGTRTRIRALQTYGREVQVACPGTRVAINLPDVALATAGHHGGSVVQRGDVVTASGLGKLVKVIDVLLEQSPRAAAPRLRNGAIAQIHLGTSAIPARLRMLDPAERKTLARISFRSPAFVLVGDRFVVRDWSEQHTLAGGVVLDVNPPAKRKRAAQKLMLEARSSALHSPQLLAISQVMRDGICDRSSILPQSVFAETEIAMGIDAAVKAGTLVAAGAIVATPHAWDQVLQQARQAIDAFHQAHPERPGLPLTDFKTGIAGKGSARCIADAVLEALIAEDFRRDANTIGRASHRPALPPRLDRAGQRLRTALAKYDMDAQTRSQLAPDDLSMQALKFLIANGEAVEISSDQVMSAQAYARATSLVRQHIQQYGPATVSELKSALSSSRRVMVPLVEKLDRDGVTHRQGDKRTLR